MGYHCVGNGDGVVLVVEVDDPLAVNVESVQNGIALHR